MAPMRTAWILPRTLIIAMLAWACAQISWAQTAQVQWNGIERVVAFADVHGAYRELHTLLRETAIIDAADHWAAGDTHLVSLGDLLDRGADSRKVMDLLMRLQDEALAAGGRVHVLLGNHEAMNLLGDLRYVDAGEFAAYADLETPAERDPAAPPGYVGQRAALSAQGRYGKWLLSQPVAIIINDTLFMHGGPGPQLQGVSLQDLNLRYRTALVEYLGLVTRLQQAKLVRAADDFDARPRLARERLATVVAGAPDAALSDTVQRFEKAAASWLLSEGGPNWYRGAALCNEASESDVLLPLLQQFGVKRLVVGHTPTRDSRAVTRFNGQLVKLDTGMNRAAYRGQAAALFIRPSGLAVRYAGGLEEVAVSPEALFVAPNEIDDASVLAALREGEVSVGSRAADGLQVTLSHNGKRIPAVFQIRTPANIRKEVAAYQFDRLLGLGMVPATVEREVQGQRGVVQGRPLKWVTQAQVQQQSLRLGGWCSMEPQFQLLYAFDVLIGNDGRSAESMLYDADEGLVYGSSHERAFGTARGLPDYLKARPPQPGAEIRRRIAALDEAGLRTALGGLLGTPQLKAILARRDLLLGLPAAPAAALPR